MSILDPLARKGFVVVTGKGGVGKSTVSAVLARRLAARGLRTLVIEVDPRENLHQLLGAPPSGGEVVDVGGGLHLQHLKPRAVVDRVVEERVRIGAVARKVFASPVYQHFVDGAPGLKELAILEHARRLLDERRFEAVVLDAPATGHGVSLLRAPLLVAGAVEGGPFGRIAGDIAALVADPERCAVAVVAQAEEM
ncbi:MAG TPA: ArsA-related P-loop ATPase, partial [Thermoanaerobaculia bacterium]